MGRRTCLWGGCGGLTSFVDVRGDVDGGGVVGDEPFEGVVDLKVVRHVAVLLPFRLIELHQTTKKKNERRRFIKRVVNIGAV